MPEVTIIERPAMPAFLNQRRPDTHKGDYGHALLVAGSYGKMGAAVLAARACLRMGAGLLTVHVPGRGVDVMQTAVPEAMVSVDEDECRWSHLFTPQELAKYDAVAVGPGLGRESHAALLALLSAWRGPVTVDADALNMMSDWAEKPLRPGMILTPHAREQQRLIGDSDPREVCRATGVVMVCKGHRTHVIDGEGRVYENTTGNAGMATAGSGDVLTGMLLGILAQNTDSQLAIGMCTILGVWLHGKSADLAVEKQSECSLTASDIVENLRYVTM